MMIGIGRVIVGGAVIGILYGFHHAAGKQVSLLLKPLECIRLASPHGTGGENNPLRW